MCLSVLMAVLLSWYQYHFSDLFSESWSDSSRFLLHSLFLALKCGHLCVCARYTWMFFKSFACPRFIGVVTTVSFSLTFDFKLNFDLQSQTEARSGLLTDYNYCPLYKMKLFILDANTCTEFMEFYCCLLVAMSGTWAVFVILLWWFTFFCPFKNQFLLAFVKGSCTTTVWWGEMITLTKIQRQVILMLF